MFEYKNLYTQRVQFTHIRQHEINSDGSVMKYWYTVHTKPRQEHIAEEHLQRQSFTVYLPCIQTTRRLKNRWRDVRESFFPQYQFIQADSIT